MLSIPPTPSRNLTLLVLGFGISMSLTPVVSAQITPTPPIVAQMSAPKVIQTSITPLSTLHASFEYEFKANLRPGVTHPDVVFLQKFLNASGFPIATFGPGSAGNETAFFGTLTKKALIAFQDAHTSEILAPVGLRKGTGYFYSATRNYVNMFVRNMLNQKNNQATSTPKIIIFEQPYSRPANVISNQTPSGNTIPPEEDEPAPPSTYSIGGTVTGLSGTISLENNATNTLSVVSSGAFSFTQRLLNAVNYLISIVLQPDGQICSLENETGTVSGSNVTNVSVSCLTFPTFGTFTALTKTIIAGTFALVAPSSDSDGAFAFSSSDTLVATVSGGSCTVVGAGTTVITATQSASGLFTAKTATTTLTVSGQCELIEPCQGRGSCENVASSPGGPRDTFSCTCNDPYSGVYCESSTENCAPDGDNYCLNSGTCVANAAGGECSCPVCFTGSRCELFDPVACA